jgi:hypothetical protein
VVILSGVGLTAVLACVKFTYRLRMFLYYPTFLLVNSGVFLLIYNELAYARNLPRFCDPNVEGNILPIPLAVVLAAVILTMLTFLLKRQFLRPWQ